MKTYLLHGLAKAASRRKLLEIKQKFDPNNVIIFDEGSSPQDIKDNLVASSLFSEERLVILENPPEDFTDYTLYPIPCTLIFWFDHELSDKKPIMEWVKKLRGEILFFPEGKEISVFPFLDLLAEGNIKAFLEMKKLKDSGFDIFYFNTMTVYLLRNLLNTPKNVPHFVANKLQRQRVRFNQKKITNLYKNILELDFKLKSGLIEPEQAEFMLVNKFIIYLR